MTGQDSNHIRAGAKPFSTDPGERLVYVMPQEALQALVQDELSLLDLWTILWRAKWIICGITAMCVIGSVAYVLNATEWYRAEVLLAPAEDRSSRNLSGTLGGLASLAGVDAGGRDSAEAIAVLRSRDFARAFIEDQKLMPVLFSEAWDPEKRDWITEGNTDRPDIRAGVKYFSSNILSVSEDRDTGLITLSVQWTDPNLAAQWAMMLVERLNSRMRQQALAEAERNVNYLQAELVKTNVLTLQQSIGRLMETELQKLMLARGSEEFAFRIVDPAQEPRTRFYPRRTLTVLLATLIGGMTAVLVVLIVRTVKRDSDKAAIGRFNPRAD